MPWRWRTTCSATEPMSVRASPERPCVPSTTRSTSRARARETMASPARPCSVTCSMLVTPRDRNCVSDLEVLVYLLAQAVERRPSDLGVKGGSPQGGDAIDGVGDSERDELGIGACDLNRPIQCRQRNFGSVDSNQDMLAHGRLPPRSDLVLRSCVSSVHDTQGRRTAMGGTFVPAARVTSQRPSGLPVRAGTCV